MCAYYEITFANGHNKHMHSYICWCLRVVYKVLAESITHPNPCKSHRINTYSNGVSDFNFQSLEGASGVPWWPNVVKLSFRYWVWIIKRNTSDTRVLSVCNKMNARQHYFWLQEHVENWTSNLVDTYPNRIWFCMEHIFSVDVLYMGFVNNICIVYGNFPLLLWTTLAGSPFLSKQVSRTI